MIILGLLSVPGLAVCVRFSGAQRSGQERPAHRGHLRKSRDCAYTRRHLGHKLPHADFFTRFEKSTYVWNLEHPRVRDRIPASETTDCGRTASQMCEKRKDGGRLWHYLQAREAHEAERACHEAWRRQAWHGQGWNWRHGQ